MIQTQHFGHRQIRALNFEALHEEISRAWQRKADKLQARRWRKLGQEFKRSPYIDSKVKHGGGIL